MVKFCAFGNESDGHLDVAMFYGRLNKKAPSVFRTRLCSSFHEMKGRLYKVWLLIF